MNRKIAQYLDVELNPLNGTVSPYIKVKAVMKYVNTKSNPLASILQHIPKGVEHSVSTNTLNMKTFENKKKKYLAALKEEGHKAKWSFRPQAGS